jgi:hypothetical protein
MLTHSFIVVHCSGAILRPFLVSKQNLPLKLSIFTRISSTTRDERKHIMDLPLIEHTSQSLLSLPGREPLIFLQRISITTEWIVEENKSERLCRVLIMYKIKGNKCSLILLASYTSVVMH